MAIQMAPPVVAGAAWFEINGGRVDGLALGLAGYALLMAMVQIRLVTVFRTAPFGPGWWAFSFSYAAVFLDALRWLSAEDVAHGHGLDLSPAGRRHRCAIGGPRRAHRGRRASRAGSSPSRNPPPHR